MSQFEFLPLITIGQYFPTGSVLHRRDARARLIFFSGLVLAITFTLSNKGLIAATLLMVAGIVISKVPLRYALRGLLTPLPFLVFIALLQIFFFAPAVNSTIYLHWKLITITQAGLWSAFTLMIRFIALILCLSLMSFCLSTSESLTGLTDLLSPLNRQGIQTMDFVMVFQVSMRFLPLLAQTAERIAKAQASRGADWGTKQGGLFSQVKRVIPLIVPLFSISLHRAEAMALAMDSRAYGLQDHRTSLYELKFHWKDGLFLLIGAGLIVLILFV